MESITVTRTVPGSPEQVFVAWTDADRLAAWWWPQLAGTTYDVDARPGGGYRIRSAAIGVTLTGVYTEVDRPRRLAFTWVWHDDGGPEPGEDTVIVTFEPEPAGARVTVVHTSAEHAPDGAIEQGWNDVLGRLATAAQESTSSRS